MRKRVTYKGVSLIMLPRMHGESSWGRLQINGVLFPDRWTQDDFQAVTPGCRLEYLSRDLYIGGIVEAVENNGERIVINRSTVSGEEGCLEIGSLGEWGEFSVTTKNNIMAEPEWLFPTGVIIPLWAYREIVQELRDWEPYRQLSWSETWLCVHYGGGGDCPRIDGIISALAEARFRVHPIVRVTHDAERLAERVVAAGWPAEGIEILELGFNLDSCQWLWLRPGAVVDDALGVAQATISRDEFNRAAITRKLLTPHYTRYSERTPSSEDE